MKKVFQFFTIISLITLGFGQIEDGCDLPDFNLYLTDNGEVFYNSSADIAGFQFNVDGATVSGGSGGDSGAAGFVVSAGGSTVLGFSFSGATIPSGCGTLVELELSGSATGLSGIVMADIDGNPLDFVYYDDNNGGGDDITNGCDLPDFNLYLTDDGEVFYNSSADIAGFQFNVDGATVSEGSGGDSGAAGFVVSAGGSTVLGFSFSGATIPSGCGTLVELELSGSATGLSEIVMAGSEGNALDFVYYEGGGNIDICDDDNACNTGDEGDCEYAEDNYDCNGDCIIEVDCEGVCGGDAVIDECGECGGPGAEIMCADGTYVCYQSECNDGEITDGCDLPDNNLYLVGGDVLYNSSSDIGGFQFNVNGATVLGAGGGDAEAAGFTVSSGGSTVLGFSFTGSFIPAGCGVLTVLSLDGDASGLSGIVVSDPNAQPVDFSYYGGDDCESGVWDCAGVCDGDSDLDECGECGGDGVQQECGCGTPGEFGMPDGACNCSGAVIDECGECGGPGAEIMCADGTYVCYQSECGDGGITDGCDLPDNNLYLVGGDVLYNSSSDIGGFQFNVNGATVLGAGGGDAEAAGFTVSSGGSTVLGFSFTGSFIPAGCGVLTVLSLDGDASGLSGIVVSDPNAQPVDFSYYEESTSVDILYSSDTDIAGFQFVLEGAQSASGGASEESGFTVSVGAESGVVLGFSFTGSTIPAGSGVLTTIELEGDACIESLILSDTDGDSLDAEIVGCYAFSYAGDIQLDCEDESACNFLEPGECDYPEENYDCDGNCVVDIDCNGDCGGDAELDECGVCDGNGANHECWDGDLVCDASDCSEEAEVSVAIEVVSNSSLEILVSSPTDIYGFQFNLNGVDIVQASGGAAGEAGFQISNSSLTVLGFSLTGSSIPAGDYVLVNVQFEATDDIVCFGEVILSGVGGIGLNVNVGDCQDVPAGLELQYFTNIPEGTGVSSLVIIQDALDLEAGDEIGLFDANAILNFGDCSSDTGGLLVGAGVWTGEQLELVGVGSVDNCAFGGFQLPGYQEGNDIIYKVWKASENEVYPAEAQYAAGTGTWGELITAVSLLEPVFSVIQSVEFNPYMVNMVSTNLNLESNNISDVLSNIDVLIAANDIGQYYVPGFGVNQIGEIDPTRGLRCFTTSGDSQYAELEGLPIDLSTSVSINPFQVNLISYLPQECMATNDVFSGHEDQILLVQNDVGQYYVPSFGVMTLTEMCPGEGYSIFLNGADGIDFTYPDGGMARSSASIAWESYNEASASVLYTDEIVQTGISHPIILTSLEGLVSAGDELVAYANDQVVGATRIVDADMPIVLAAWGGYHEYGVNLPGYDVGDPIELRLYSLSEGRELYVQASLEGSQYGVTPITSGEAIVLSSDAVPAAYDLMQNYPNPFNPSTSIGFTLPESGYVSLNVYDMTGRLVTTLVEGNLDEGVHMLDWNGSDSSGSMVSAGVYFYTLESSDMMMTKKMILMK